MEVAVVTVRTHRKSGQADPDHETVVIGAGPGGICAGVLLKQRSLDNFVILERADEVGGTWRDNDYPGIGVDVPGFMYQYSFARNPRWSRLFPKGAQVKAYHQQVADDFGLMPHLRFGVNVVREIWDEAAQWWRLECDDGSVISTRFLISAVGAFMEPKKDAGIPGLDDFVGKILSPTDWDHSYDLTDKNIAVIGTGASSVQITPSIAAGVKQLDVYQRTPVWCLPKPDMAMPPRLQRILAGSVAGAGLTGISLIALDLAVRSIIFTPPAAFGPFARRFDNVARWAYRAYLARVVQDQSDRVALAPTYGLFGKRPTFSNEFLQTFNRDNVSLVTSSIVRITPHAIETGDGRIRPTDALVLATGYEMFSDPESYRTGAIVGRNGFDLGRFYTDHGLQAYQSVALPGLPNRWMLIGPYSWTGTGWHAMVEISAGHAVRVIEEAIRRDAHSVAVGEQAHSDYHRGIIKRGRNVKHYFTSVNEGLRTYYVNSQGDVPFIRPTSIFSARRSGTHVKFEDYEFAPRVASTRSIEGWRGRASRRVNDEATA